MKAKSLLLFLCFFLVISVSAQNQDKVLGEYSGVKAAIEIEEPGLEAQVTQGDKPGVQILACNTLDEDTIPMQMIRLSENDEIYWYVEYTGVYFSSDASFHFIITGPEFFYYQTDFVEVRYKQYQYSYLLTNNNWKKGTYTLTVIAELDQNRSGAECIGSCRVRLY